MNDGTPNEENSAPWSTPIAIPSATAAAIARYGFHPCWTFKTAMSADVTPLTAPTDRSISPRSSTNTTPTEMSPVAVTCRSRLVRLTAERKRPFSSWKMIQMTAIATMTRTETRSP